jgi:hypothetical protein
MPQQDAHRQQVMPMHCRLQFVPDRTVPSIPSRRVAVVFTRDFDLGPKPARLDFLLGGGNIRVHVFPTLGIKPNGTRITQKLPIEQVAAEPVLN